MPSFSCFLNWQGPEHARRAPLVTEEWSLFCSFPSTLSPHLPSVWTAFQSFLLRITGHAGTPEFIPGAEMSRCRISLVCIASRQGHSLFFSWVFSSLPSSLLTIRRTDFPRPHSACEPPLQLSRDTEEQRLGLGTQLSW